MNELRVAVLDDEVRMARILAMLLRRHGYDCEVFHDPSEFVEVFCREREAPFDLVISDLKMPGMSGIEVLARVRAHSPKVPVIMISAHGTVSAATEAMKLGAVDFIEKPFENERVLATIERAAQVTLLDRQNRYLRSQLAERYRMDDLIVGSEQMRRCFELARRAARSKATVLIWGESGTGKEVVSRYIHYHSQRVGEPMISVNCKAFSPGVLESELFGHRKGAFTGAVGDRRGIFERASGGTLFLDEIGEVEPEFQTKLLRVLQEGQVLPVGADRSVPVDVRLVAATNKDLEAQIAAGRFREDLYFRLAVIPIHLPPLRERREEILPLARHFLSRWCAEVGREIIGWSAQVESYLVSHDWPGNVRELENVIERAVVMAMSDRIELEDLLLDTETVEQLEAPRTLQEVQDAVTIRHIRAVLAKHSGSRALASRDLGVDRTTLYRLMKKYGIDA